MATVRVREMQPAADLEDVVGLYMESARWHAEHWPADQRVPDDAPLRQELTEFTAGDGSSGLLVAEVDRRVVGLASGQVRQPPAGGLARYDGPILYMGDIIVTASYRARGIGRRLMDALEAWGRGRGAVTITLQVHEDNQAALHLYQSSGMRRVDVRAPERSVGWDCDLGFCGGVVGASDVTGVVGEVEMECQRTVSARTTPVDVIFPAAVPFCPTRP